MVTLCDKCGNAPKRGLDTHRILSFDYCTDCMLKAKNVLENWNHDLEEEEEE